MDRAGMWLLTFAVIVAPLWPAMSPSTLGADSPPQAAAIAFLMQRSAYQRGEVARIEATLVPAIAAGPVQFAVGEVLSETVQPIQGRATWALDTRLLKAGDYEITCRAHDLKAAFAISIAREPNPQQLPFVLLGGATGLRLVQPRDGEDRSTDRLPRDTFDAFLCGLQADPIVPGSESDQKIRQILDLATRSGLDAAMYAYPAKSNRFNEQPWMPVAPNGKARSHGGVEIARPEIQEHCQAMARSLAPYGEYPSFRLCLIQSEFEMYVSYSDFYKRRVRDALGIDLAAIRETLTASEAAVPESGVVADDHPLRRFYFWWWRQGSGLTEANARIAAEIKAFKPSVTTWHEPYRMGAVLGTHRGVDAIGTWTYTFPDPKYIASVEVLKAAARPARQKVFQDVTLWEYAGWLAPRAEGHQCMPGDIARECFWIVLSLRPDIIGAYLSSFHASQLAKLRRTGNDDVLAAALAPFEAIRQVRKELGEPFGPTLLALKDMPRRVALLSLSTPLIFPKAKDIPRSYYPCEQVRDWYALLLMTHIPADVLLEEQVEQGALNAYDVAVLPFAETISQGTFNRLRDFLKQGKVLVADKYLRAKLPGVLRADVDFAHRQRMTVEGVRREATLADDSSGVGMGVSADTDRATMNRYATHVRQILAGCVRPYADCDSSDALLNVLERGDTRYVFVVNDKRQYGPQFGKWKAVHERGVAQTVTLTLHEPRSVGLFDPLKHKAIAAVRKGDQLVLSLDLLPASGRVVAICPSPIDHVAISAPLSTPCGQSVEFRARLSSADGQPVYGACPIRIEIIDPQGQVNEYSRNGCAIDGSFAMTFTPAINEARGPWRISVTESCTAKSGEAVIEVH